MGKCGTVTDLELFLGMLKDDHSGAIGKRGNFST
jgi:hypothetical protein